MAVPLVPRLYIVVAASVVVCTVFFLWTPFQPATVSKFLNYTSGIKAANLEDIRNETLGFEKIMIVNLPSRPDKLDSNTLGAALTGFRFEVTPGISADEVPWKSLPYGYNTHLDSNGTIGAYRALLNAIRSIVADRVSTALIMEDDIDWDVSLKTQLQNFALGSRFLTSSTSLPYNAKAQRPFSPYGDGWDVLNLGHCGGGQHTHSPHAPAAGPRTFRIYNDPTTPPPNRVHTPNGAPNAKEWAEELGTRFVYRGWSSCSWAHAVSQRGARKILDRMSVEAFSNSYDNGLQALCQVSILDCIQIHPPLLGAHTPIGPTKKQSDMDNSRQGITERAWSHNVAYSVKSNFLNLVEDREAKAQWIDMPDLQGDVEVEYIYPAENDAV